MKWILVTIIACCYGFFRDFRPSEAFLTQYLTGEWKNLTLEQVNSDVYPCRTYAYVVCLIPVFLLTDYFRYKPTLVLDALVYIFTWCLLVWAQGITLMTSMQVLYGLASAAEVGYYSYLYAMVDKKHFRKVTSIARCSSLLSKFVAFLVGQLFVSFEVMDLRSLNMISFSCVCFSFCISLFLPKAKKSELFNKTDSVADDSETTASTENENTNQKDELQIYNRNGIENKDPPNPPNKCIHTSMNKNISYIQEVTKIGNKTEIIYVTKHLKDTIEPISTISHSNTYNNDFKEYFHEDQSSSSDNSDSSEDGSFTKKIEYGLQFIKKEIRYAYSSRTVILWSLWWIFASYGNFQTGSYIQDLWKLVRDANGLKQSYNGAVEAAGMLLGSVSVGLVGFVSIKWSSPGRCEILMTTVCALRATMYVVLSRTNHIWVAYVLYDCLRVLNQVAITVETAEIAKALPGPRYGFVFGCNMFLSLVIESVFTAVVVDHNGFGVNVRTQFLVYGIYSFAMTLVFGVVAAVMIWRHMKQRFHQEKEIDDPKVDNVNCDTKNTEFITHL